MDVMATSKNSTNIRAASPASCINDVFNIQIQRKSFTLQAKKKKKKSDEDSRSVKNETKNLPWEFLSSFRSIVISVLEFLGSSTCLPKFCTLVLTGQLYHSQTTIFAPISSFFFFGDYFFLYFF